MKKLIVGVWLASACAAGFAAGADFSVSAAVAEPKTAREFFMSLPTEYLKAEGAAREKMISGEFESADHLLFTAPVKNLESWGELKVLPMDGGKKMVCVVLNACVDAACLGQPLFLIYDKGEWTNVSDDVRPVIDMTEVVAKLKQREAFNGKVSDGDDVPLTLFFINDEIHYFAGQKSAERPGYPVKSFKWNGSSFTEQEKP